MARLEISIPVPNASALAAAYDRVLLYRSQGPAQPFLELTNPRTRHVLAPARAVYTFVDPAGDARCQYASGLINTATGAVGPMSEPVSGLGDPSLGLLSVSDLKTRYLFGLPLSDRRGNPLPDSFFAFYIQAATSALERDLDITLAPTVVENEQLHFKRPMGDAKPFVLYTHRVPIQSVQALRLKLPYATQAQNIPAEWLTVAQDYGSIYLYPRASFSQFILPMGGYAWSYGPQDDFLPNAWQVDYVAGFPRGRVPPDLLDALGMMAALSPLAVMGDLVLPPGIGSTSLGIDGLSQSISGKGGYADRINTYLQALASAASALRMRYRGTMLRGD